MMIFNIDLPGWLLPVALVSLGFLVAVWGMGIRRRSLKAGNSPETFSEDNVLVAFASQSGFAESIAWKTAATLNAAGLHADIVELGNLNDTQISSYQKALFIVSTTGSGAPPDSARRFARQQIKRKASFEHLEYAVLALGDRSYDHYCAFGRQVDGWLSESGAKPITPLISVNNEDDQALKHWQQLLNRLAPVTSTQWEVHRYFRWRLVNRTLINANSPGNKIFHIALKPVGIPPVWAAGDIAVVFPGPAAKAFSANHGLPHREYSVASIPADGQLELVVRQAFHPGGELGPGSGWLTAHSSPDEQIALRIRSNRAFHGPDTSRPMILIGNGTGIAGLRAHLKARFLAGAHGNWLVFGERTSQYDWLFRKEIESWQNADHIKRLDLAFSRDEGNAAYVQDRLYTAALEVQSWVDSGAAIYVCGDEKGMAADVDVTLTRILGSECLDDLRDTRRYCRDVY